MAGKNLFPELSTPQATTGRNLLPDVVKTAPLNPVLTPEQVENFISQRELPRVEGESRAVRELPEIGAGGFTLFDGEETTARSKAKLATMFTTDPQELGNILKSISPNIGITQTPEGDLIANNNETGKQVVLNKPGFSVLDVIQGLGMATAFTPAAAAANIPKALAAKAGAGALASAATQTGIETIQSQLGGEMNPEEIAISGALGGAAELVVPAIQAFRNARRASAAKAEGADLEAAAENIQIGKEASEATKIRQFPAQQTLNKADLEAQSFLPELPASTQKASEQLKLQNEEASQAVDDFLRQIAPDESVVTGPAKFRTAAEGAIEKRKMIRREKASPIYNQAFKQGADVDVQPVNALIDSMILSGTKVGESFNVLTKAKKSIETTKPKQTSGAALTGKRKEVNNLKQMHEAKLELDEAIQGTSGRPVGNNAKAKLMQVKESLLEQIESSSPSYTEASKKFAEFSPPVNQIEESIIGNVANLKETQLKDIATRIFNPSETNPKIIQQAKKVIEDIDPDAWNQLLRTELEKRLGKAKTSDDPGIIDNTPSILLNSIFGNDKQKKVLFNAVDGDMKKNLKFLEVALKRASLGRPGGSQTAGREAFKKRLDRGVIKSITNFIKNPIKSAGETGVEASINKKLRALSETLFNPEFSTEMAKIRKLGPESPASARAMSQLLRLAIQEEELAQSKAKQTK